jgi:hypothetical protein
MAVKRPQLSVQLTTKWKKRLPTHMKHQLTTILIVSLPKIMQLSINFNENFVPEPMVPKGQALFLSFLAKEGLN